MVVDTPAEWSRSDFLSDELVVAYMKDLIAEAQASVAEDDRPHPLVGALLVSTNGKVLLRSHRDSGRHAEFNLLEAAARDGIVTKGQILFTTLEPCTRRGIDKIPCAERVAAAQFGEIFIGTLDPDPGIRGRGEMFLASASKVERYPSSLAQELAAINRAFFESHSDGSEAAQSLYAASQTRYSGYRNKPGLLEQRNGLLQITLDLISAARSQIWIVAGDLSWLEEAQAAFLLAHARGCAVRCIAPAAGGAAPTPSISVQRAARGLGVEMFLTTSHPGLMGTIIDPKTEQSAAICIDAGAATVLRRPEDTQLLALLEAGHERLWSPASTSELGVPRCESLANEEIVAALKRHVPQYAMSTITLQQVAIADTLPMTRCLEQFKQSRLAQLEAVRKAYSVTGSFIVAESPWPVIVPPVVERTPQGHLVVIDGTHRTFDALSQGREFMPVLLVENVGAELPAVPVPSWDEVRVFSRSVDRSKRYKNYNEENFRPIRAAYQSLSSSR